MWIVFHFPNEVAWLSKAGNQEFMEAPSAPGSREPGYCGFLR
jgi:hypothetical protein